MKTVSNKVNFKNFKLIVTYKPINNTSTYNNTLHYKGNKVYCYKLRFNFDGSDWLLQGFVKPINFVN